VNVITVHVQYHIVSENASFERNVAIFKTLLMTECRVVNLCRYTDGTEMLADELSVRTRCTEAIHDETMKQMS